MREIHVAGIPDTVEEVESAIFRSRLDRAVRELAKETGLESLNIKIALNPQANQSLPAATGNTQAGEELSLEQRAAFYHSREPLYTMQQLFVPDRVKDEIAAAMELIRLEPLVFDSWGLREIEPFPRSVLNLHGPPGTGKTLAAHAIASEMGKPILSASYADIESKYHGDGPKNVEALFHAARREDAVLFIDEADSLLSRRLTNVTQGSEQAINSMRSQLLICLEQHTGIVVFASNLVENYDPAFETRVRHIRFPLPDRTARAWIWSKHLPARLPLCLDVNLDELAMRSDGLCGREIRNAVVDAAVRAAQSGSTSVGQVDLLNAVMRIFAARKGIADGSARSIPPQEMSGLTGSMRAEVPVAQAL